MYHEVMKKIFQNEITDKKSRAIVRLWRNKKKMERKLNKQEVL